MIRVGTHATKALAAISAGLMLCALPAAASTKKPVEKVESPVDLMGAGDAFAAGCIAGLLRGLDLVDAARLGVAVASLAIQMPGNIEAMPTWEEVQRAVDRKKVWTR